MVITPPTPPAVRRRTKRKRKERDLNYNEPVTPPPTQHERRTRSSSKAQVLLITPEGPITKTQDIQDGSETETLNPMEVSSSMLQEVTHNTSKKQKSTVVKFPVHDLAPDIRSLIESTPMRLDGLRNVNQLPTTDPLVPKTPAMKGRKDPKLIDVETPKITGESIRKVRKPVVTRTRSKKVIVKLDEGDRPVNEKAESKNSDNTGKIDSDNANANNVSSKKKNLLMPDFGIIDLID